MTAVVEVGVSSFDGFFDGLPDGILDVPRRTLSYIST